MQTNTVVKTKRCPACRCNLVGAAAKAHVPDSPECREAALMREAARRG